MTDNGVSENEYTLLTLTIPARAKYNETTVQCASYNIELEPTESEIVDISCFCSEAHKSIMKR